MDLNLRHPIAKFLLRFAGLYLLWFLLYDLWLHPKGDLDSGVVFYTIWMAEDLLELLGYSVVTYGSRILAVEGTSGLSVGDACNAVTLIALFAGFMIAYPGKIKRKLYFIALGSISIYVLNVLRIVALAVMETISRSVTEFNHSYTFTFLMYGYIFFLWYWFIRKEEKENRQAA